MGETVFVPEPLNGGLVTARDPATLEAGELTLANNAIYLPNDPAIHKVKGRTKYNTVALGTAGNVKGLRYLEFDGGTAYLAAHESDDILLSSFTAETGTFGTLTPLTDVGSGTTLDAVHHQNRYVLLIGAGTNQVVRGDATSRRHGLAPTGTMNTAPALVTGAWNTLLGTGFYHFLTTEVFKDSITGEVVESGFNGIPVTTSSALITPASQSISITQPTVANSGTATHWRIYMAGPTTAATPIPLLATFKQVAEVSIATTVYVVGNQTSSNGLFADTATGWTNPTNVLVQDGVSATTLTNLDDLLVTDFDFAGLSGVVQGIEVRIRYQMRTGGVNPVLLDTPKLILDVTHNGGANFFPGSNARFILPLSGPGVINTFQEIVIGNAQDLWERTGTPAWPLTDINANTGFGVRLRYGRAFDNPAGGMPTIHVDSVQMSVYTTGSAQPVNLDGVNFRTVNVSVAGITTSYSANGPPPVATTGDMFEGQLVLNDVTDQSLIRYSLPDNIEAFPSIYFLNFETKTQDFVTLIRRLGNKLIVGLKQQLYRINYLPRESDAEFDRGRSYEPISESEGIVGPQAAALFSPDGGPLYLAYISHLGPRYTDGFQTFSLNDDLDWGSTVRLPSAGDIVNYLDDSILVNYPTVSQLWFYYTPVGSSTNSKALVIHYSKDHQKGNGTFKITGPIDVAAFSAINARLAGNDVLLTGQASGFTFVEDRGYTHNAGGTIPFAVQTRELYPTGLAESATVEALYTRHRQDATSTVTVTPLTRVSNNAQTTQATKTFTTANAGVARQPFHHNFDSVQWKYTEPGADGGVAVRISGLTMEIADTGVSERTA